MSCNAQHKKIAYWFNETGIRCGTTFYKAVAVLDKELIVPEKIIEVGDHVDIGADTNAVVGMVGIGANHHGHIYIVKENTLVPYLVQSFKKRVSTAVAEEDVHRAQAVAHFLSLQKEKVSTHSKKMPNAATQHKRRTKQVSMPSNNEDNDVEPTPSPKPKKKKQVTSPIEVAVLAPNPQSLSSPAPIASMLPFPTFPNSLPTSPIPNQYQLELLHMQHSIDELGLQSMIQSQQLQQQLLNEQLLQRIHNQHVYDEQILQKLQEQLYFNKKN